VRAEPAQTMSTSATMQKRGDFNDAKPAPTKWAHGIS
jgi:hypothetical protein